MQIPQIPVQSDGTSSGAGEMNAGAPRVHQAVILAAGLGSRIRKDGQPLPKPLVEVGGEPLLKRTILTGNAAGVERFVIITGCMGDVVRDAIEGDPALAHVELVWVDNPDYALSNGVSVLCARPFVEGEFFLTMSDHILDAEIFETLQRTPARDGLVLAVDYKLDTIFDMDDATKVGVTGEGGIGRIGKQLTEFDAVDTGVFRVSPALFESLAAVYHDKGDTSLSDGVQALARRGAARVADIGDAFWQDVDDMRCLRYVEQRLLAAEQDVLESATWSQPETASIAS
jgi:choline kinase